MRERKIRAWDKETRKMYIVLSISFDVESVTMWSGIEGEAEIARDFKDVELMDYTGLKDKNGKEIYEGDIIKYTEEDEDSAFGGTETDTVEVRWIDDIGQYRAVFASGRRVELHFILQLPTIRESEIIGNIYENPELL